MGQLQLTLHDGARTSFQLLACKLKCSLSNVNLALCPCKCTGTCQLTLLHLPVAAYS